MTYSVGSKRLGLPQKYLIIDDSQDLPESIMVSYRGYNLSKDQIDELVMTATTVETDDED